MRTMRDVFLTVADLFAEAMLVNNYQTHWFRNATRCLAPQGGAVGFVSLAAFSERSEMWWSSIRQTSEQVEWTPVGDRMYCVCMLCADADMNGASAQPVVIFSRPVVVQPRHQ